MNLAQDRHQKLNDAAGAAPGSDVFVLFGGNHLLDPQNGA
jgi:hypothetical protein